MSRQVPGAIKTDDLIGDLRRVINAGVGSVDEDVGLVILPQLRWVQSNGGGSPLLVAKAAEELVEQAIRSLANPTFGRAAELLFGAHPSTAMLAAKARRERAAAALGVDKETFQRHEQQRLLRYLARRIADIELELRADEERLGPPPTSHELEQQWLERFRHYQQLQEHLRQMRHEIIEALLASSEMPDEDGFADARDISIWRYAKFLSAREAFIARTGGVWFFPESRADGEARRAIDGLRSAMPFNERARSLLRAILAAVPREEMYPFAEELRASSHGMEVVGLWEGWLGECDADLDKDDPTCAVHVVIDRADAFVTLVQDQWELLEARYR